MLCKPCSLLSPQPRWKASLGAPQGTLEMPLLHSTFSTRHSRTPNTLGSSPTAGRLQRTGRGEGGEVKIELIPQNN